MMSEVNVGGKSDRSGCEGKGKRGKGKENMKD